jgi:hypothetical protein
LEDDGGMESFGGQMTRELELLETIPLENGLALCLYNGSKVIADKLWYVSLTGKVDIPVSEADLLNDGKEPLDIAAIREALGDRIFFEKKMERNFVVEDKKSAVLQLIRDYFMDSIVKYLSHPDFSRKYIVKCYREYQKKKKFAAALVPVSGE